MQVRLLGPVDVTVDGQARAINGLRRTALAAALALRAGEVVSADLLTEIIWESRPPPGPARRCRAMSRSCAGSLAGLRSSAVSRPDMSWICPATAPTWAWRSA